MSPVPVASLAPSLLPRSAVPGIPARTSTLTVTELTQDAVLDGLGSQLARFGYQGGAQRVFQGNSRHLTYVESRTLAFATPAGAQAYVDYVRTHSSAYFGAAALVARVRSAGRSGWRFQRPLCACPGAAPDLVALVADGDRVEWLEVNGPDAGSAVLASLLARSGRVPANG